MPDEPNEPDGPDGPDGPDPLAGPPLDDPDDAYANAPHIPDADAYLARWPLAAAAFRESLRARGRLREALPYGPHPRERMDVFAPAPDTARAGPVGVAVIVHGGYWMRFDRGDFSHLAAGTLKRGWVVALPGYPLCPEVGIARIETSVCRAIELAATLVPGAPLRLAGHSAGGQLAARAVCADAALDPAVAARIERVLSISGVHDLVPLLATSMREPLGLDGPTARRASPARATPRAGTDLIAWVGGDERPEFVRQNALPALAWSDADARASAHVEPGRHHFDVIEDLERADSAMLRAWLAP